MRQPRQMNISLNDICVPFETQIPVADSQLKIPGLPKKHKSKIPMTILKVDTAPIYQLASENNLITIRNIPETKVRNVGYPHF